MDRALRLWRHLSSGLAAANRAFSAEALAQIEQAVREAEARHSGEIRFVVEAALTPSEIWAGLAPRQRAIDVFSQLRVWDTVHNNGVLIYLLLADHAVEIVADRGVAQGRVAQSEWDAVCRLMETEFRAGRFLEGAVAGVRAVADILAKVPPGPPRTGNEMPDAPVIIP